MARDFKTADGATLLAQSLKGAERLGADRDDDTRAEYLVGVKWEKTFDRDHAQWESGMFYGQSTICKFETLRQSNSKPAVWGCARYRDGYAVSTILSALRSSVLLIHPSRKLLRAAACGVNHMAP